MLVPHSESPRVTLAVVSLGRSSHLEECLAALKAHQTTHDFAIVWVSNHPGLLAVQPSIDVPEEVHEVVLETNLGWSGGLHVARALVTGEYLIWIQDDMVVADGWLDALVDAADAHPEFAALGSRTIDDAGNAVGYAAGSAIPGHGVATWNDTDTSTEIAPSGVERYDWITSKGMLSRLSVWDEVGGPDPRLFPLNHVDKDYCSHLRAHGYSVALVADSRLHHHGSLSAPSEFRHFLLGWQEPRFDAQWGPVIEALGSADTPVDHPCAPWRTGRSLADDAIAAACSEAALMLVPLGRHNSAALRALQSQHSEDLRDRDEFRESERARLIQERVDLLAEVQSSASWRITAPIRALARAVRRH